MAYNTNSRNNRALASLQGYINPFYTRNTNFKIPDGKATFSSGITARNSFAVNVPENQNCIWIALVPGLRAAYTLHNEPNTFFNPYWYKNDQNLRGLVRDTTLPAANVHSFDLSAPESRCEKLRLVSAGMKLFCPNAETTNDGWFEAIRIGSANPNVKINRNSMIDDPTYFTGKISDLSKYFFQCKPMGSHDFHEIIYDSQTDLLTADATFTPPLDTGITSHTNDDEVEYGALPYQNLIDPSLASLIDKNFDTVVICLRTGQASDLVISTTHNFEVIFHPDSSAAHFHTACVRDKLALGQARAELMKNIKAGDWSYHRKKLDELGILPGTRGPRHYNY